MVSLIPLPLMSGIVLFAIVTGIGAVALVFGGPRDPPPMASINNPFRNVDFSNLPPISHFPARDGASLAFRYYPGNDSEARGSIVLVHGSSAGSSSMHGMASAFAAAGYPAYALDIRGHGESGTHGKIAYIGRLDDLEDFLLSVNPVHPVTLGGFSSGGGFALRFAGSARQNLFSGYLLLSPFISQDAPTYRPDGGGWARVGIPRLLMISLLNVAGVRAFNGLAVIRYAVSEEAKAISTPEEPDALEQNFRPDHDYRATIRAVERPLRLVAGQKDEVFYSDRFAEVFKLEGKDVPVTLVPGTGHISLTLEPDAIQAAVAAVRSMDEPRTTNET